MAIRPNDEERGFGADREQRREVTDESGRSARNATGTVNRNDNTFQANASNANGNARTRSNRGFASMDRAKQREIASKGGRAAHQKGTAHEFDSNEARAAGRKGGVTVSRNREHMAAIGRRGGEARGANRAARIAQQTANTNTPSSPNYNSDREVELGGNVQRAATTGGVTGSRQSGSSLGGEARNNNANTPERSVERP
jgi:general stress protein YciG